MWVAPEEQHLRLSSGFHIDVHKRSHMNTTMYTYTHKSTDSFILTAGLNDILIY